MTSAEHLDRLVRGAPKGYTRQELAHRLRIPDRQVRQLIEDAVASAALPIVADRTGGGEARYRLAGRDEIELVNTEVAEHHARAASSRRRAEGLRRGFMTFWETGSLFMHQAPPEAQR